MSEHKDNMRAVSPYFFVTDVVKSAEYYRDVLGFSFEKFWGKDEPNFVIVYRDGIQIMLAKAHGADHVRPNRTLVPKSWDAYVFCRNVETIKHELEAKGARILRFKPATFYEMKELEIEDDNGYILCFGEELLPTRES